MSDTIGESAPNRQDPALRAEVATIGSDPTRYSYGPKLENEDPILLRRGGGKGLDLYDDLRRDPKVGSVLQKRISALVGREWSVEPGEDTPQAQQVAQLVREALGGLPWNRCVRGMLGCLLKGVSMSEVIWKPVGARLMPVAVKARNPRRFEFTDGDGGPELRLLTRTSPTLGEALPARKFIVHRHDAEYGNPWGNGLGQRLFWPVFFKRQGVGFWLSALEKFGQPTVLGRYEQGSTETDVNRLLQALQAVASEAAVAIPEGMAAELLEAKRSGTFDGYASLARYMDDDIAQVVLGETLTSSAGEVGSRALGEVHDGVRLELTKADADELSDTLNTGFIRWIVELNEPAYVAAGRPLPRIWWDVSVPEDAAALADRDTKIHAMGYDPSPEYIAERYGPGWVARAPAAPDPIAALFAEAAPRLEGRLQRLAPRRRETLPAAHNPRDAADDLADQLGPMTGDAIEPWLAQVRALVEGASDMQEVADGLLALYPQLGTDTLARLLGRALTVAELTGRADLTDDRGEGQ